MNDNVKQLLPRACVLLLLVAGGARSQEAIVTLRSTVTGNQEQPRVMYIVPWQQPGSSDFDYEMHRGIADELFAPVDREEFVRELGYEAMISSSAGGGGVEN